jgi:hypothetical protein
MLLHDTFNVIHSYFLLLKDSVERFKLRLKLLKRIERLELDNNYEF